jgi:hypothetical protein
MLSKLSSSKILVSQLQKLKYLVLEPPIPLKNKKWYMFIFGGDSNPIQKWSLFGFVHVAVPHHALYGRVPRWLAESARDVRLLSQPTRMDYI